MWDHADIDQIVSQLEAKLTATMGQGGQGILIDSASREDLAGGVLMVPSAPGTRLIGFAVREQATPAAAAVVNLRKGQLVTDGLLVPIELLANESAREWWWPGIPAEQGIFAEIESGTVDVVVFFAIFPVAEPTPEFVNPLDIPNPQPSLEPIQEEPFIFPGSLADQLRI